jgi:propanol-preferring alcohol dehydrogenase
MTLPASYKAMVLEKAGDPLVMKNLPTAKPGPHEVLVKIIACGVCRTDLHIIDGELTGAKFPLVPGHEIIGTVVEKGSDTGRLQPGELVGIPWLGFTCGTCKYCKNGKENLCMNAKFTGYTVDGGFAEYTIAQSRFCFRLDRQFANAASAPLLCAGLIGFRAYRMIPGNCVSIGLYGFGAAAHILAQIAIAQGKKVYAFTRNGDKSSQDFARSLGVHWAGNSTDPAPVLLDAAIIFASAGELVPKALSDVDKGGIVVCAGIHMSDIPAFPYKLLWGERTIRLVANLTREDGDNFFSILAGIPVKTTVKLYKLEKANEALNDLRSGHLHGAAVLIP